MKKLIPLPGAHSRSLLALNVLIISFLFFCFTSCRTQKQVQYLQGRIDTATLSQLNIPEPQIQKRDLIGITIYSDNAAESAIFNQGSGANTSLSGTVSTGINNSQAAVTPVTPSYLVDLDGNIRLQSVGLVKAEGLTKQQLALVLQEKLSNYLKNPYCNIRFLNYKFTMLGEVTKQGVYTSPVDNITIFEALGLAGDITVYGLKDSILIMREIDGKRVFGYMDVSAPNVVLSPFYYLRQNDVVFVRSDPKKPTASDQNTSRNFTIVATIAAIMTSLSVIIFNVIR